MTTSRVTPVAAHQGGGERGELAGPAEASQPGVESHWRTVGTVAATLIAAYVVLVVLIGAAGFALTHLGPVTRWDDRVNAWVAARRSPMGDSLTSAGTLVANTLGVVVVASLVTIVLFVRRWGKVAGLLWFGLAVELSVFLTVNVAVGRPRPSVAHVGSTPSTSSFPSGHAAATMVVYGGLAVLVGWGSQKRAVKIAAWVVAAAVTCWVGLSRIYEGEHHPTDVMAGVVLGGCALWAAAIAARHRDYSTKPLLPSAPLESTGTRS